MRSLWQKISRLTQLAFALALIPAPAHAGPQEDDICKRVSDAAKITGTRILFINFEGLAGFSSGVARNAEMYRCQLMHQLPASKPGAIFASHGLRAVMVPVIEKYKNKVRPMFFAHDRHTGLGTSVPEVCATIWMNEAKSGGNAAGRKVFISGHSFGGDAAHALAHSLSKRGVPVEAVFTFDPRRRATGGLIGGFSKSPNVKIWKNYYQVVDILLRGYEVKGAENFLVGPPHVWVPHNKAVLPAVMQALGEPPGEALLEKKSDPNFCKNDINGATGLYGGTDGIAEAAPIAIGAAALGGAGYLAYKTIKKKKEANSGISAASPKGGGGGGDGGGSSGDDGSTSTVSPKSGKNELTSTNTNTQTQTNVGTGTGFTTSTITATNTLARPATDSGVTNATGASRHPGSNKKNKLPSAENPSSAFIGAPVNTGGGSANAPAGDQAPAIPNALGNANNSLELNTASGVLGGMKSYLDPEEKKKGEDSSATAADLLGGDAQSGFMTADGSYNPGVEELQSGILNSEGGLDSLIDRIRRTHKKYYPNAHPPAAKPRHQAN